MESQYNSPVEIGAKIKRLIKETGKTQEEFSSYIPVEVRTLRRWLKEGIDSYTTICRIAKILNKDVFDILSA